MESKFDVARSMDGGCYICSKSDQELYLVRQIKSGRMNALCSYCLLHRLDDYMIDNTRPWPITDADRECECS